MWQTGFISYCWKKPSVYSKANAFWHLVKRDGWVVSLSKGPKSTTTKAKWRVLGAGKVKIWHSNQTLWLLLAIIIIIITVIIIIILLGCFSLTQVLYWYQRDHNKLLFKLEQQQINSNIHFFSAWKNERIQRKTYVSREENQQTQLIHAINQEAWSGTQATLVKISLKYSVLKYSSWKQK